MGGGEHGRHWLWLGIAARKNLYAFHSQPSPVFGLLLNGAILGLGKCGRVKHTGRAASLCGGAVMSPPPHPRCSASQEQLCPVYSNLYQQFAGTSPYKWYKLKRTPKGRLRVGKGIGYQWLCCHHCHPFLALIHPTPKYSLCPILPSLPGTPDIQPPTDSCPALLRGKATNASPQPPNDCTHGFAEQNGMSFETAINMPEG